MSKISDKLKTKAKMLMLKAALTATVVAGVTGAEAQNVKRHNKNKVRVEKGYNAERIEMSVPPIVGEKSIDLSDDRIKKMVELAEFNETQMEVFVKNIKTLQNSPQGVTNLNFVWIMNRSADEGIFTRRQMQMMENKAFEYSAPVKSPEERIVESGVRPDEKLVKIKGTFVNNITYTPDSGVQGSRLFYDFDNDGTLKVEYDGSVDLRGLLPSLVQRQDGSYRCGVATGFDRNDVIREERQQLTQVVIENMVYRNLQERQQKGTTLGKAEQNFMKQHVRDLQQHGLSIGKKGLQKIDLTQLQQRQR